MSHHDGAEYSPRSEEGRNLFEIVTNDPRNMRTIFQKRFNKLTQNTKCGNTLINKLYEFGVLDLEDKNTVSNGITEPKQMEILYHIVEKYGRNWSKLIRAWEPENQHIITMMLKFVKKPHIQHNQPIRMEMDEEPGSSNVPQAENNFPRGPPINTNELHQLVEERDGPENQQDKSGRTREQSFKKVILFLVASLPIIILTITAIGIFQFKVYSLLLLRNENHHNITSVENKTVAAVVNLTTVEPLQYPAANITETKIGVTVLMDENSRHHESITNKSSKLEFSRFIRVEEMKKKKIEDPLELSKLPDSRNELFLVIAPKKLQNWKTAIIFKPDNVRAIAFAGYLNPESVISITKKFRLFLTHITFSFENNLCDEFYDYTTVPSSSKIDLPFLQEIHFEGDVDCGNVFRFIINEISLRNIRILKFTETNMIYNSIGFVREIFQHSQSTLEYIYLNGVSFCSNCKLFGNLELSKLKLAEFSFDSGASAPENADAINRFNSDIPVNCRSTYPNEKKVRVEC